MNASRRVGRYTKHENAELLRMFVKDILFIEFAKI